MRGVSDKTSFMWAINRCLVQWVYALANLSAARCLKEADRKNVRARWVDSVVPALREDTACVFASGFYTIQRDYDLLDGCIGVFYFMGLGVLPQLPRLGSTCWMHKAMRASDCLIRGHGHGQQGGGGSDGSDDESARAPVAQAPRAFRCIDMYCRAFRAHADALTDSDGAARPGALASSTSPNDLTPKLAFEMAMGYASLHIEQVACVGVCMVVPSADGIMALSIECHGRGTRASTSASVVISTVGSDPERGGLTTLSESDHDRRDLFGHDGEKAAACRIHAALSDGIGALYDLGDGVTSRKRDTLVYCYGLE